jgi:hypothetical protein
MATEAQIAANRRNASRSTGPKTAKGKARSSQNATSHGLFSKAVVLSNESRAEYDELVRAFVAKFQPRDPVEMRLIQRLADCEWRLTRARYLETASLDSQMSDTAPAFAEKYAPNTDDGVRLAFAIRESDARTVAVCSSAQAQENRLQRQYSNIWRALLAMRQVDGGGSAATAKRKNRENEPNFGGHGRGHRQDLLAA